MKKHLFNVAAILGLFVMLTVVSASAQTAKQLSASVPFNFTVGQKTLPAGKYTIYRTSVNTTDGFLMRDEHGRVAVVFKTHAVQGLENLEKGRLEFRRLGDRYFLARFWVDGDDAGRELEQLTLEFTIPQDPALKDVIAEDLSLTTQ